MVRTNEKMNFFKLSLIIYVNATEGLRKIFKIQWDAWFTGTHGQWDDTPNSYKRFYDMVSPRSRVKQIRLLNMMSSGNRQEWDFTCLSFAILHSGSVAGKLSPLVKESVDILRVCRNKLTHNTMGQISETEFQLSMQNIKFAFSSLKLDIAIIEQIGISKCLLTKEIGYVLEILKKKKRNAEPNSFCILPPRPMNNTIHRKEEFDKIYRTMQQLSSKNEGKTTVVYLTGVPGCGKSEMARQIGEMCYHSTTDTKFVMTLDASSLDNLLHSYITFAEKLNCYPDSVTMITTSKDLSKEEQILQLKALASKQVTKYSKWWIIADNVTDLNIFSQYCTQGGEKTGGEGQILVTTQDSASIPINPECCHVSLSSGMTDEDAIELLSAEGHRDVENHVMSMTAAVNIAVQREITEEIMLHALRFLFISGSGPIPLEHVVEYVAKYLPDEDKNLIALKICSSSPFVRTLDLDLKSISIQKGIYHYFRRKSYITKGIVPSEILARGPKAHLAYQTALKSGKVKNCRVPIIVVGQSGSGKTSLLRSLYREKFNPSEDSTVGAKLQRSLCRAEEGEWEKTETDENTVYNRCAARAMAPQLLTTDSMESDNDDSHDNENSLAEETVENDDTKAFPVEKKVLHFDEDSEVAQEETTQEDFHKDVLEPKQLPEQVAICAENILENPESAKQMENDLFLHTMDFAGQPVYSVTHPVFLPPKGIFLLVHNLENDLHAQATPMVKCGAVELTVDDHCPMTNMDHLEFWLSLVAANSTLEGGSPVFVVSTHADKFSTPNAETIARKILLYLKRDDFSPGNHVVRGIHIVDNTISGSKGPNDPGVQNLKVAISNKARSLPQFDEDIPIRWLLFEKSLMNVVKEEQKKYISREDAKSIALQCEVEVESDEFRTLLEYLHDLKVIIYFPETNMIIIDTQWLLDMFAKVITVLPIECHEGYEHEWEKLEDQGIVDETFLKYLWKDDSTPVQSLITIMEKFSLICKQQDGSYLVPAMLLNAPECHELMNTDEMASSLVIRFKSSHLPFGVFPRLFAAVHKLCSSRWPDSTAPSLSRNFARFYIANDAFSLVLISDVQTITVALVNEETPGSQDDYLCSFLLKFLRKTLPEMMESFPWMKSLEFEFGIHCPICEDAVPCTKHNKMACSRDSCAHFIPEKELLKKTKPRCHKNPTKRNVIPPSSFSLWFRCNNSAEVKESQEQIQEICSCSCSTEDDQEVCQEVIAAFNQISLKTISQDEVTRTAKRIADTFNLDKNDTATPPKDITQKCRASCKWLIAQGGEVFVEALRNELPSGMTGPLRVGYDVKVCDMDSMTKTQFSQALTAKEMEWKAFAKEKVGLSSDEIEFLDKRKSNPVLEILNEHCHDWSVEQLYDAVVSVGADAIADRYL